MILACPFCAQMGLPAFVQELPPYGDLRVVEMVCGPLHVEAVQARLEALAAALRAQAQGEAGS